MNQLPASVIVPAYTMDRWELLKKAVCSIEAQTVYPAELILCIDHNESLFQRAKAELDETGK